jgi:hypothetical protein
VSAVGESPRRVLGQAFDAGDAPRGVAVADKQALHPSTAAGAISPLTHPHPAGLGEPQRCSWRQGLVIDTDPLPEHLRDPAQHRLQLPML